MGLKKIKLDTSRSYDISRLEAVSKDIRKELLSLNMNIFTDKSKKSGDKSMLKKNLARSLTLINEKKRSEDRG